MARFAEAAAFVNTRAWARAKPEVSVVGTSQTGLRKREYNLAGVQPFAEYTWLFYLAVGTCPGYDILRRLL